jgi:hypothetical protein
MISAHTAISTKHNRAILPLLLLLVYYLPPFLIWIGVIPFDYRFHTLVFVTAFMAAFEYFCGSTLKELGFRKDTLKTSLLWNGALSIALVAIMCAAYWAGWIRKPTVPDWNLFFVFYVFVSSPSQEFLFRSTLFAEMKRAGITKAPWLILISAITYSFLHIFYQDLITLSVTLFMGVLWGLIYYKHPNFAGVALSHAVLGVVSILVGII